MGFGDKVNEEKYMLSYYTKLYHINTAIEYTDYNFYTPFCCFGETVYSKDFYILCIHLFTRYPETEFMLYACLRMIRMYSVLTYRNVQSQHR